MKYYKFTCSNGYCGCDEEFYEEVEENTDIDKLAIDILNGYSFYEPDGRFLTHSPGWDDYDYDEYEEDYDEYIENLSVDYIEITKEEYEENRN